LRFEEIVSTDEEGNLAFRNEQLGMALMISNVSVLAIGVLLMIKACMTTSEGDFVDVGYVYNEKTGKFEIENMDGNDDDDKEKKDKEESKDEIKKLSPRGKSRYKISSQRSSKKPKDPSEQYLKRNIMLGDSKVSKKHLMEFQSDVKAEKDKKLEELKKNKRRKSLSRMEGLSVDSINEKSISYNEPITPDMQEKIINSPTMDSSNRKKKLLPSKKRRGVGQERIVQKRVLSKNKRKKPKRKKPSSSMKNHELQAYTPPPVSDEKVDYEDPDSTPTKKKRKMKKKKSKKRKKKPSQKI